MTTNFYQLLDEIRSIKKSEKDVGDRFEEVVQVYFNHDQQMQQSYGKTVSWDEWVKQHKVEADTTEQDRGIDLVAEIRGQHGGGFAAIQVKCRQPNQVLRRDDIDRFFTKATSHNFDRLIYIDTTERKPSDAFQEIIEKNEITHITAKTLADSTVDWEAFIDRGEQRRREPKQPLKHQLEAVSIVREGLLKADRGQIIMACGTGKTYTGLLVAQQIFGVGKRILVLVPSLALMSQMIREWHADATLKLRSYSVCSDIEVGRRGRAKEDVIQLIPSELMIPPTTDPQKLAEKAKENEADSLTVIFGTYHSLAVINEAQKHHKLPSFDLILCDEAHRTTGQFDKGKEEEASMFVRVHDSNYVQSKKRLYMTATPRIYTTDSKTKAREGAITLCSMDNPEQFGKVLYYKSFAWAVQNELLSDYRVIVLAIDERTISSTLQQILESDDSDIKLDDATKIVGCFQALMKEPNPKRPDEFKGDTAPCRRVLTFCNTIKKSKIISNEFSNLVATHVRNTNEANNGRPNFSCSVNHIDGTSGAHERNRKLTWLANQPDENEVRILSNVRCLGEGVDVPSLDAIVFFHPRKSQIDVVQAVGRVMRRAPGKKYGYVVLPVAIPSGKNPVDALKDNKTYETVWQILNALRSHDERLAGEINRLQLEGEDLERILLRLPESAKGTVVHDRDIGTNGGNGGKDEVIEDELNFKLDQSMVKEFRSAIFAQIVRKVGRMSYWEDWAADVGKIAQTQITRISTALETDEHSQEIFQNFVAELQDDLNPSVTGEQAIELLAQHIITQPVFNALFEGHKFIEQNSVSIAMEKVLKDLDKRNLERETESLKSFYDEVKWRIQGTKKAAAKQQLVRELYDKFFRRAFPRATEMLGIAFTPVEIVDYVNHSIEYLLNKHFQTSISDEDVHIIDPFVGTGTFITRLLQSGIIRPADLRRKYQREIHANEIVLLAYYVAGINIEAVYHDLREEQGADYEPYERLVFQDTFQSAEHKNELKGIFPFNHERIEYQQKLPLTVVFGNPPYSKGQKSQSDNAQNVRYPKIDERIKNTYVSASTTGLANMLYDSYVRAFRWASDRLGERGIVGFVTGAGWLDGNAASGVRACFEKEFAHIYVVNLRGNARLKGDLWRKEGEKIFGQASRSAISLTFLVKDASIDQQAKIYYHDIGDYLKRDEKLKKLEQFQSLDDTPLQRVKPNRDYDWINQRDPSFERFLSLHPSYPHSIFHTSSKGMNTARDAWIYNYDKSKLIENIEKTTNFFNDELDRYVKFGSTTNLRDFVNRDRSKIAWNMELLRRFERNLKISLSITQHLRLVEYRPFTRIWCFFHPVLVTRIGNMPTFFPTSDSSTRMICTSGMGATIPSCWQVRKPTDLNLLSAGANCFPISIWDEVSSRSIYNAGAAFASIRKLYTEYQITFAEFFDYIYGILQHPEYTEHFGPNLQKELPRIPIVETLEEFKEIATAGALLANIHVDYDKVEEYSIQERWADREILCKLDENTKFRVEKMKFPNKLDKSIIRYNSILLLSGIPDEAYEFQVNGKSLVDWVMDRQRVTVHKDSGVINDANSFAIKTMNDPAYPLRLLKKAIAVGIKTHEIRESLPLLRLHKKFR
ncbi:MAG: DEAD/DEAH box helicase family protein [Gammaproteobacteria bacterium]|nr:DEAD/DEAH box helicase family protein [Gammaproteobacteria bacterium]